MTAAQPLTVLAADNQKPELSQEEAGNLPQSNGNKYRMWYTSPGSVSQWENTGLLIGNGTTGGILFGQVGKDQIHFNEKTLWTGGPSESRPNYDGGNRDTAVTPEQLEAIRQGADDHSSSVFPLGTGGLDNVMGDGSGMGHYQDFGDLYLDFSETGMTNDNVDNYVRDLDMRTAVSSLNYDYEGVHYEREYFVSHPDKVMVIHLTASEEGKLSFTASAKSARGLSTTTQAENGRITLSGEVNDNQLKCEMQAQIVNIGGEITDHSNGTVTVDQADEVIIVLATGTDYKNEYPTYRGTDPHEAITTRVDQAAKKDYEDLKADHISDHQELFDRVSLDLGGTCPTLPTDQMMKNYRAGDYQLAVEEMIYQFGRYLTIAGSREGDPLPTNLVGIWSVGDPAWGGDFHFNVNVQMNYWPAYSTNLAECGTVFNDFMESLVIPGRLTAEKSAGVATENFETTPIGEGNGFLVNTQNNPFGCTTPFGSQEYGWNIGGSSWGLQNMYDYYLFTGDEAYLRDHIYPMLKEMAEFWNQFLWYSEYQDRLVVGPSVSAEQGPTVNGTTYDQSLAWEVYKMAIEASEILGVDADKRAVWAEKQSQLDPILIGEEGQIKEWYEETRLGYGQAGDLSETKIPNFGAGGSANGGAVHRHTSQLIGLYPGTLINQDTEEWMDAAIVSLEQRSLNGTGWSKAMKINMYARTGLGDDTYKMVRSMCAGNTTGILDNLLDSHPPFQIDGNYGLTAGITEMLLQSQLGYTQFLPALPQAWQNGSVQGIKSRGNFTIGETWENGLATTFTVCYDGPQASTTFTGDYTDIAKATVTVDGKEVPFTVDQDTGRISFEAEQGKTYVIDMSGANADKLVEMAENFLTELHPDLTAVGQELRDAIQNHSRDLSSILKKAQYMDRVYREYVGSRDNIYYMTTKEGLSKSDIDAMYVQLRQFGNHLVQNDQTLEEYVSLYEDFQKYAGILQTQMDNRTITFSKESGMITQGDNTLTLTTQENAAAYRIRYTVDGSQPTDESPLYHGPITLDASQNTTVRAALFLGAQRVSPVYTKQYSGGIPVSSVSVSDTVTHWDGYDPQKMIDGNAQSRWASREINSQAIELTLDFDTPVTVDHLNFDVFVSNHNKIGDYDIQALVDGTYQTVCQGTELVDGSDDVGGNHGYAMVGFEPVTTTSLNIILKNGYQEPSIWEIQPLMLGQVADQPGDPTALNAMVELAEAVDRTSEDYVNADALLKAAFEESIADAKSAQGLTQAELDSREEFLRSRYTRLGFGETDKTELEAVIAQAEAEAAQTDRYTRDSIYRLNRELAHAKDVFQDAQATQPTVEAAIEALQTVLASLVTAEDKELTVDHTGWGELPSGWLVATENHSKPYLATKSETAGTLEYTFQGYGVKVLTMNGPDQGTLHVEIAAEDGTVVYEDDINAYAEKRLEGAVLMDQRLEEEGTYTLNISKKPGDKNWVEVGEVTIFQKFQEEVDRSRLQEALDLSTPLLDEKDQYTPDSWATFEAAYQVAQTLMAKEDTQTCTSELNDVADALNTAREGLKLQAPSTADKTLLQKTYDYAITLSTGGVTDTAKKAFEAALESAKAVLDNTNATQAEVDEAWDALLEGIWGLGLVQGDKSELNLLIAKAEAMTANQNKYVETHWQQLVDALSKAKDVAADGDAMEEDIQPVAQALLDAILAQRFKADKSILEDLLNKAENLNLEGYTAESVAVFRSALAEAQAVLADKALTEDDQKTVDAAVAALSAAMDSLTAEGEAQPTDKPEATDKPESTDKPQATETPEASKKPEATQQPESNVPQTGDTASLLPWAAALALSGAAALWVVRRKERN